MKKIIKSYSPLIKNLEVQNKIKSTILDNTNGNMYIYIEYGEQEMNSEESILFNLEIKSLEKQ